jgi:hypothetical protein
MRHFAPKGRVISDIHVLESGTDLEVFRNQGEWDMFKTYLGIAAALLTTVVAFAPACATRATRTYYAYPTPTAPDNRAYDRGFQDGHSRGETDARARLRFDYSRHDSYRNADDGYRGYGDRDAYRSLFRQGFVAGYDEGYRRYAPVAGASNFGVTGSVASATGYRDGYQQGMDDARHHHRFEPADAKRYRDGDHDYDSHFGSRDQYRREYRVAFEQGYERAYNENR